MQQPWINLKGRNLDLFTENYLADLSKGLPQKPVEVLRIEMNSKYTCSNIFYILPLHILKCKGLSASIVSTRSTVAQWLMTFSALNYHMRTHTPCDSSMTQPDSLGGCNTNISISISISVTLSPFGLNEGTRTFGNGFVPLKSHHGSPQISFLPSCNHCESGSH